MIKILMVKEIRFALNDGEYSKLQEGKAYEAIQKSTHFLVPVEGRRKEVYVPKDFARIVEATDIPKVATGTIEGNLALNNLQHFSRPESDHYHTGGIDVWKFAEANFDYDEVFGFHRIDAIKYLTRFGKKQGRNIRDLEKARAEIDEMIRMEKERTTNG